MLDAAGSFGSGLVSVLTQIAPLAEWVSLASRKWDKHLMSGRNLLKVKMRLSHSLNIQTEFAINWSDIRLNV